jgi:ABC-2 type transport system ATP-binding protein
MVRSFIEGLKQEKITVFLCTHNLAEASNLSDRVCFIKQKIIRIATLSELQAHDKNKGVEIVFRQDAGRYGKLLESIPGINSVDASDNTASVFVENPEVTNPEIIRKLVNNDIDILYVNEIKASLEDIYLELIKDEETK